MNRDKKKKMKKWLWMMDYCKKLRIPPAQEWAWNKAEKAYNEYIKNISKV